jgi:putative transposase
VAATANRLGQPGNCSSGKSTWPPKTKSRTHSRQPACVCKIRRGPRSPGSVSDSGAGRWRRWLVAKPDTILAWYPRLIAQKFDGSKSRSYPGRPRIDREIEALVVQMARENSGWGYDRIAGVLTNLGYHVSDQTVGNILRRHGMALAPKRSQNTTWKEFIASHMADLFTLKVLTWRGLVTCYVLFFIHLENRWASLAGVTRHSEETWMQQMARNATDESWGYLDQRRYALQDRDAKRCPSFRAMLASGGIKPLQLSARSPNLNASAER